MRLVVLGSGTASPHPERSSAGFWLETKAGKIMLDFGASALHRLAQEKLDWWDLDAIWISHFHLDHCCGLAAYLFATRRAPETRDRARPLRIVGGNGLKELLNAFDQASGSKLFDQPYPIEIVEIEPLQRFEIVPGLSSIALKTPHTAESLAIRIEDGPGTSFCYTSDTGFGPEIAAFARDVNFLLIEASFFKDKKTDKHLELAEAMYLIRKARPKRAMLTHLYAEWDKVEFGAEVAKFEPLCEVIEAVDGLRLDLRKN